MSTPRALVVAAVLATLFVSFSGYAQRHETATLEQSSSRASAPRGLDPELTAEALRRASGLEHLHTLLVARHGATEIEYVAAGPGLARPANIKSLSKTVLSALVGAAIDCGVIEGVDQPVVELLGDRVPAEADPRVGEITVGHLLSMRAGLERTSGRNYGAWVTSDDWVAYALTRPFVAEPGTSAR